MGEICNIKLDSTFSCLFLFTLMWHIWNVSLRCCEKQTYWEGWSYKTKTPVLTLVCYSDTSSISWAVKGNWGYKKEAIHLGSAGQRELLLPKLLPYHMHCWVTAQGWHQTHSRQETGLLKEIAAADRALPSASPACVPPALHVGVGRSSDTPQPGRATSHPGFCTLTKQKWPQQGSNNKKSSNWNTGKSSGILELTSSTEQDFYCLGKTLLPKP